MDPHADFHGLTIVIAIAVAICGVLALLIFFFWIERHSKRGSRTGADRGKVVRSARKKKRK
ncbi:hypothetical protein ACFQ09_20275 [Massilia norwichensis]|jgi:hypothetical protein|uniref:Uncharacterized protein n=1 Tax=Massilia norwichensis TaxID=1442366 RepID=A0ABT2A285_9BURK|nr:MULTISPECIES: hypothetical protein [Massilia]MCS0588309.1 hypothetical protein [Massilia norwichensis]